jgi:hypothetical protein
MYNHPAVCLTIYLLVDISVAYTSWLYEYGCVTISFRPFFKFFQIYKQITGSYGNFIFNFEGNHHTIFRNGYTILHFYQRCTKCSNFFVPHQYPLVSAF